MSFLGEIKRRRVFQVAVVYAVVAWGLVEIVATVEEPLGLPNWVDTFVIVLVIVGFPLALILSWVFDLTPAGVVRTPSEGEAEGPDARPTGTPTEPASAMPELLKNSVAVLPLDNLSPNPDDAYFAAGIHEEILNYVAKINDVNVIARTSVKRYADSDKPIAEIARELGVGTVMEGSVRYAGDRVRVTAQLIDAATENHLWSEIYERDLADIFAIQADIAEKIAGALAAELSVAEKKSIEKLPTRSSEAYALYLRAMTIVQDYGWSNASLPEFRVTARSHLDEAVAADPEFALAYAQRGRLFAALLNQDPGELENYDNRRAELERRALGDLEKALKLDPGVGAAHGALARIHQFNWRGREARAAHERALQLAPNDTVVLTDYAVFTACSDDPAKGLELARRAANLNPSDAQVYMWLSMIHLQNDDPVAALETERLATELAPSAALPHVVLTHLEHMNGDDTEALKQARLSEELLRDDRNPAYLGELISAYARIGKHDDARRIFERLRELSKTRRIPIVAWLLAYIGMGDDEEAYRWLTKAADNPEPYHGYFSLLNQIPNAYGYALLDEPRFKAVRDRMGFKD